MAEEGTIPLNEEHLEANQCSLDKERYDYVSKLTPEQQKSFRDMEKAVETLIGTNRPFIVLAAPERDDYFWRYQKYSNEKLPLSEEESKAIMRRAWFCIIAHASHFAKMTGHEIIFAANKKPYYVVTEKGDFNLDKPNE